MSIDPNVLKRLRIERGFSRAKLASLSRVSAKQIQRLESPNKASKAPREWTVDRLARTLQVDPEVLTGDAQLPEPERTLRRPTVGVHQRLYAESQLAYDLVEQRYGVQPNTIMNMAPLFFVLLAEGSLAWRKRELAAIQEALNNVWEKGQGSNRTRAAWKTGSALDDTYYEAEAIEKRDLLNDPLPYDYDIPADDDMTVNPFVEYLQKFSEKLDVPGLEVGSGFVWSGVWDRMPAYSVCKDELEKIACRGSLAFFALEMGDVRVSDIPEKLKAESTTKEREEWLASRVSKKSIEWLEEQNKWLRDLGLPNATPSSNQGGEAKPRADKEVTS